MNILGGVISALLVIGGFFSLIFLTFHIVYVKSQVIGFSMQPYINSTMTDPTASGDTIYINKFHDIELNDVVVAKVSWHKDSVIKRVVGTPGDTVEIRDLGDKYGLYVNEKELYTREKTDEDAHGGGDGSDGYFQTFQTLLSNPNYQDHIVMNSQNNPCFKLSEDEYFLMGDNWGETVDSSTHGPVKRNEIVGRVELLIPIGQSSFGPVVNLILSKTFGI